MKTSCDYCPRPAAYQATTTGYSGLACPDHLLTLQTEAALWANDQSCPPIALAVLLSQSARRPLPAPLAQKASVLY